jgi:tRNA dimethylallyltransferase
VGPTGVGKSRLAINLASLFKGEIVNADSRQVYRHMDIGTAKPNSGELKEVPHHLFNIINPDQDFGLAQYIEKATKTIKDIQSRGNIPFLVGGSGQYIWSILEGWEIPKVAPDLEFRKSLENIAKYSGMEELYNQLLDIDPDAAKKIDKRNIRRVIRAIEVSHQANVPFSQLQKKNKPDDRTLIVGLTSERSALYQRVDARVDNMFEQGFLNEVENLNKMGYDFHLPAMNSIGYKQISLMQQGEISPEDLKNRIKVDNHRFIRHQYAWFRLRDERIAWFDTSPSSYRELINLIADHIDTD